MSVPLGGTALSVPKNLANEIETVPARNRDRRKGVPEIMDSRITEARGRADALPDPLYTDEMTAASLGRKNVGTALLPGQANEHAERRRP